MWLVILFTLVVTYVIYYTCFKPYNYWKNRGIVYEIPVPVVGNFADTIFKKKHAAEVYDYIYKKYSSERYVGIYIFMKPALLVRDLDLIRRICEEEPDHFSDRVETFDKNFDDIIGNGLASLKGIDWKEARNVLDPVFAVTKLGSVFDLTSECAETFSNHFVKDGGELLEIQLSNVFSRYDCDVISRICFGVTSNSLDDEDNEFFNAYHKLKTFGAFEKLKLFLIQSCPFLAKILQIKAFPTSKIEFYKKLVVEALNGSINESKVEGHFLKCMIDSRKGTPRSENELGFEFVDKDEAKVESCPEEHVQVWKEDELTAHILMFLNSHIGADTILSTSSFLAYELALNPSVQVKLQEEIDNVTQSSDGKITYEAVSNMKYLHCVISECLRKWPPVYQIDRQCVKNFFEVKLTVPDDEKIVIEKNTAVTIPIMAIQRDSKYFPQPEKFSPERFNEDIVPGSYMPFGRGPRNCIGSNLALLQIKLLFFHLLSKFDLVPTQNTVQVDASPSQFDGNGATNNYLGLKPRIVTSL